MSPIAKPQKGQDPRELWRTVAECSRALNSIINMSAFMEAPIRCIGQLAMESGKAELRFIQLSQFNQALGGSKQNVTVSVSSDDNPSEAGDTVHFTALLSNPAATGTIQWLIDGAIQSTGATFTYSSFTIGTHTVQAVYSGDTLNNAAVGTLTQTVNAADITVTVTSDDGSPSQYNQTVHFTATVSDSSATGTIQWQIDGVDQGAPIDLVAGTTPASTFQYSGFTVGNHTVTAVYSGDATFSNATGSFNQSVVKENTQLYAFGTPNPFTSNHGGASPICVVTMQVLNQNGVLDTTAGGTFTLRASLDGGATFSTVSTNTVVSGQATQNVFSTTTASVIFKVFYSGDANHNGVVAPNPFQFTEVYAPGGGGGGTPAAFNLSGPGQTQLGTLNTYTLTDATGSNYTGTVQIIVPAAFVTEYRYGGFIAFSGTPTVSNGSSNYPINVSMVSGSATFQMRVQGGVSINYAAGDFANGYVELWVNGATSVNGQSQYVYIQVL